MSQEAAFPCEKGGWVKGDASEYKSQRSCTTVCIALPWEKCGGCVLYLLLWQWNGSSCFVLQQKAEIIRIWINKIHATLLIILLFCFVFSLFCWKVWEAQYHLLQPVPPQRRQVRWDMKNLSLKTDTSKITEKQKGKICCQFSLR